MENHFADRLRASVVRCGAAACVGFDPVLDRLPPDLLGEPTDLGWTKDAHHHIEGRRRAADAFAVFGRGVLEAVADTIAAVKINIAFFEPFRGPGLDAYHELVRESHRRGLVVIGDVKRADIGHTSQRYALAHLGESPAGTPEDDQPDAVTINPYFGWDGVGPFVEAAEKTGRGVFVLVQTSNASAVEIQGIDAHGGGTVAERVGDLVEQWAQSAGRVARCGDSLVGAVVSPRDVPSTIVLRERMPHCLFLVPGFGAQGRSLDEVAHCFRGDGTGALVTASRSVIYAFSERGTGDAFKDWRGAVRAAAGEFVEQLRSMRNR